MSAQKCLREGCSRKVDASKRGEVFCYQHRGNVADATGAAKASTLSDCGPTPLRRERIEHSDPEFGGVPQPTEAEEPLEGLVIDSPEQRAAALLAEREERAQVKAMLDELRMLHPLMEAYAKTKDRYDELKSTLRDRLPAQAHDLNGVEFVISEKDVFDAKLAAAAAATTDAEGNKIKPLITKAELEQISVMKPDAAMAGAVFKNRPDVLKKLKKPQRSISIKSVKPVEAAKAADAA